MNPRASPASLSDTAATPPVGSPILEVQPAATGLIVVDLTGTGAQDAAIGQVAWEKLSA